MPAPRVGLEPTTTRLTAECSTIELSRNIYLTIVVDFFLSATFNILSHFHRFVNNFLSFFCMYLKNCTQTFHPNLLPFPTLTFWSSPRPISSSQLHALQHFHPCPIYLVVFKGVYFFRMGHLILRGASRLDAFSVYPFRTWLPGRRLGSLTGTPAVRPSRSSRTKDSSSQISYAHAG